MAVYEYDSEEELDEAFERIEELNMQHFDLKEEVSIIFIIFKWFCLKVGGTMIVMPKHISIYNACTDRCDMLDGPCACGAWHKIDGWASDKREGRSWVMKHLRKFHQYHHNFNKYQMIKNGFKRIN